MDGFSLLCWVKLVKISNFNIDYGTAMGRLSRSIVVLLQTYQLPNTKEGTSQ